MTIIGAVVEPGKEKFECFIPFEVGQFVVCRGEAVFISEMYIRHAVGRRNEIGYIVVSANGDIRRENPEDLMNPINTAINVEKFQLQCDAILLQEKVKQYLLNSNNLY